MSEGNIESIYPILNIYESIDDTKVSIIKKVVDDIIELDIFKPKDEELE